MPLMRDNRCEIKLADARPRRGGSTCIVERLETRSLLAAAPSDVSFPSQYALANTDALDAWDITTGSAAIIIAQIDTGVDYTHPDLFKNIWINQAEIPPSVKSKLKDVDKDHLITFYDLNRSQNRGLMTDINKNGFIDAGDLLAPMSKGGWDDGINGKSNSNDKYTDDIIGWDFVENDNNPFDDKGNDGHGTHTAGILGAQGNNKIGVSGVMQKTSIMPIRIFKDNGDAPSDSTIAAAIRYGADNGAKVSNNSWGSTSGYDGDQIYTAIKYAGAKGQVFVAAAGNDSRNLDGRGSDYPAEYSLDNIVAVAATDSSGRLASYSDYGSSEVDIAAPGDNVLSTLPGGKYGRMSGTSMATPMVAGTVALMLSSDRSLSISQIKQRLLDGADESANLNNRTVSDGQLNIYNAVAGKVGIDVPDNAGTPIGGGSSGGGWWHWRSVQSNPRTILSELL
jgi:subtilisin family serine protease